MKQAIKKQGKIVCAYHLGDHSETECRLIEEGLIRPRNDGTYELFSLEAVNGSGQIACRGDYFKLSSDGHPYPNDKKFFEEKHRHLENDRYEQIPAPLDVWCAEDEIGPEIRFLLEHKGLVLDPSVPEKYFTAPLWGTLLSAAQDAVLVFYSITRDADGTITDADFNFVARDEFERTYSWL